MIIFETDSGAFVEIVKDTLGYKGVLLKSRCTVTPPFKTADLALNYLRQIEGIIETLGGNNEGKS